MRLVQVIFMICLFVTIVGIGAVALSQSANPPISSQSSSLIAFDWDGNFADGTAGATANEVQLEFAPEGGGAPTVYTEALDLVVGTNSVGASLAVAGLADGVYNVRARVRGANGVLSAYSAPIAITVDSRAPSAPINVRVEVKVVVNVGVP